MHQFVNYLNRNRRWLTFVTLAVSSLPYILDLNNWVKYLSSSLILFAIIFLWHDKIENLEKWSKAPAAVLSVLQTIMAIAFVYFLLFTNFKLERFGDIFKDSSKVPINIKITSNLDGTGIPGLKAEVVLDDGQRIPVTLNSNGEVSTFKEIRKSMLKEPPQVVISGNPNYYPDSTFVPWLELERTFTYQLLLVEK